MYTYIIRGGPLVEKQIVWLGLSYFSASLLSWYYPLLWPKALVVDSNYASYVPY